jgi:hypothetical protein
MTIPQAISALRDAHDRHRGQYEGLNPIWSEVLDFLGYVLELKPRVLYLLRMHCGIFTGDIPWQFWHAADQYDAVAYATQLRYPQLIQGVPAELMYGEPANPYLPRPLGVNYRGHSINPNVVRFQSLISNLYLTGLWENLKLHAAADQPARIVEIGPGYGGLAEFFLRPRARAVHFIALDFPEILAFALGQVAAIHPNLSVVVATKPEDFASVPADRNALFLVPCFDAGALAGLPTIDLAFNTTGFQEMNTKDVTGYLDLIMPRLAGLFYSDNINRHHINAGQSEALSTTFQRYGALWPPANAYDKIIADNGWNWFYSTFIFGDETRLKALKKNIRVYFGPGKTGGVSAYKDGTFTFLG